MFVHYSTATEIHAKASQDSSQETISSNNEGD